MLRAISRDEKIIKNINNSKMLLDLHSDSPHKIEKDLALNGVREPGSTRKFTEILQRSKENYDKIHVFDIGANIGYFTLLEARILEQKGKIYSIEPEPRNLDRLKENIKANNYENIKVLENAISNENMEKELVISNKSNTHAMKDISADRHKEKITVSSKKLDTIIDDQKIAKEELIIVRMDIEGYEGYAFEGMENLLNSENPIYIFVELHKQDYNPRKIILDQLTENNFELEFVSPDGGKTIKNVNSREEIPDNKNMHLMAKKNY